MNNQWQGYYTYPRKLVDLDPCEYDTRFYNDRLRDDSSRLFTDPNDIKIQVLDIPSDDVGIEVRQPIECTTRQSFEELLARDAKLLHRFYFIRPSNPNVFSWSELHISEELTRKLLTAHRVIPAFLDCLHSAGAKSSNLDSTYGRCKFKIHFNTNGDCPSRSLMTSFELCYNISYAARNGRRDGIHGWSIRQTSVYHRYQCHDRSNVWILVKPSARVGDRITETFNAPSTPTANLFEQNPLNLHMIFLSSASENWRAYFNSLEEYFLKTTMNAVNYMVDSKLHFDRLHPYSKKENDEPSPNTLEVSFEDVQLLQKFEETVHRFQLYLENNESAVKCLKFLNDRYHKFSDLDDDTTWDTFNAALECYLLDMACYKRNVGSLLRRVHGRSRLLYNVLEFQTQETVSHHSQFTTMLQKIGRRDSDLMVKMSEKTINDAVGMKIVTFLAMLYLPLTCVMTFLQSGILKFQESRDGIDFHRAQLSKESFLLFLLLTIPLLLLTLGTWYVWNKLEVRDVKKSLNKTIAQLDFYRI